MKQLFLAVIAAVGFTTAYAQPHSLLVYGDVGYSSTNANTSVSGNTTTTFSVHPGVGYQFNDHITVGVQGGYNYTDYPTVFNPLYSNYTVPNTTKDWSAGAFFRYTKNVSKRFFLYGQLNASYISSENQYADYYVSGGVLYSGSNYTVNSNGLALQLFPAVGVNVYRNLALNFSIGGLQYTSLNTDGVLGSASHNSNAFNVTLGQQVNIGISKNFTCHADHHRRHKMHHGAGEPGMELRKMDMPTEDDEDAPKVKRHKKHHKDDDGDDDDDAPKRKKHHNDDDDK